MKYKQLVRNAVTTFKKTDNNANNVHVVSIYIYTDYETVDVIDDHSTPLRQSCQHIILRMKRPRLYNACITTVNKCRTCILKQYLVK